MKALVSASESFHRYNKCLLTPFPPIDSLGLHVVLLWVPTTQCKTRLGILVLEVVEENLARLCICNVIRLIILAQQMSIVLVSMLIICGDVVIVRILGLQLIFLGL